MGSSWLGAPAGLADSGRHDEHREPVLCVGDSDSEYDPPLTLVPRETRVHTEARYTCGVAPGRTVPATGSLDGVSPTASCDGLSNPRITETVAYADGKQSSIVYTSGTTTRLAGAVTVRLSGQVTKGRGEGQPTHRTVVLALPTELPTECLLSGLRGNSGRAQLEILL
ncbi:hypothetical protein AF335_23990 [Streptomyces eurocidicus]|uniref:Uncharacterized protein n=1 Tax=Streptomyces eurocidicus TaxID=66423 RepID=A0A2N8NQU1_STREU|nr:hypothetical protein AF335_23990 [Streptomyces eurocidicus]